MLVESWKLDAARIQRNDDRQEEGQEETVLQRSKITIIMMTMMIVMTAKMTNQAGRDSGMRSSEKTSRREEERRSAQARSTWRKKRGYSSNWDGQNKRGEKLQSQKRRHPSPRCFGRHEWKLIRRSWIV